LPLALVGLGACGGRQGLDPVAAWREVSGAKDAARPEPPGLDRPFPSLGSVPPRPDRPSPEAREAITAALAADRGRSREPVALRSAPGGGTAARAPGMAAGPPPRPALAAAPRVPWTEEAPSPPPPRAGGTLPAAAPSARPPDPPPPRPGRTAAPAAAVPEVPDAAPAPPPPDLLGAPPPPPDLLAPPPPARR
jgi:hypothetical protein